MKFFKKAELPFLASSSRVTGVQAPRLKAVTQLPQGSFLSKNALLLHGQAGLPHHD